MRLIRPDGFEEHWTATPWIAPRGSVQPTSTAAVGHSRVLRSGLAVFFLLVIVEGAIRKWLLPQQQELVYLAKDVWLVGLICVLVVNQQVRLTAAVRKSGSGALSLLYVCWVLLEGVNPALPSLTLGLWGVRSHVLYASLIWLVPVAFHSSESAERWLRTLPIIAVPVLVLGVVQFFSPATGIINRYAVDTTDIVTFGQSGAVRVSGTFPYISGMAVFVFAVALVALVLLLAGRLQRRKLVWLGLTLAAAVTPMTGARWSIYVWLPVLPLLAFEMARTFPGFGTRLLRLFVGLALIGVPVGLAAGAGTALTSLAERASDTDDTGERLSGVVTDPIAKFEDAGLFGFGAGSTHQAASALVSDRQPYDWLPTADFEGESGRLILELGLIGFLLVVALKVSWVWAAHRAVIRARTHAQLVIAMVSLGFFVAHVPSTVVFNSTAGALYWGLAGALACVLREQNMLGSRLRHGG